MIGKPCFHRWRNPQGLVNPPEVVEHEVQRYGMGKVLDLLAEGIGQGDSEVRQDSFFSMSIPEAAKKFLAMKKKPQTTQEIADALEAGGMTHSSEVFANTVGTALHRLEKNDGEVVRISRGKWGLAGWYPGRKREA